MPRYFDYRMSGSWVCFEIELNLKKIKHTQTEQVFKRFYELTRFKWQRMEMSYEM